MAYNNELQCGLWPKVGRSGAQYWSGTVKVDGKEYYLNLFANQGSRTKPNAPDYSVKLNPVGERAQQFQPSHTLTQDVVALADSDADLPF